MNDRTPILRDFFYLDVDRIRSLLAQLREGIPEAFEKRQVQRGGGGIKLGLSLDYAYERADSETRSVHHYMYSLLEETLRQTDRLQVVDASFTIDRWSRDGLPDGTLVLANGYLRLLDFEKITEAVESMPRILEIAQGFQKLSLKGQLQKGLITQREYEAGTRELSGPGMDRKDIKEIVEVVREMYSDALRLKVLPFDGDKASYLVGNLSAEHLQHPRSGLWLTGGVESQSKWWAMGIVNHLNTVDPASTALPEKQTLEDHIEQILLSFSAIAKLTTSVELPALSFTPLAIYRLL